MINDIEKLISISLVYMSESMNLYIIYPFVPFLLVHYGVIANVQDAGLYSGLFSSLYFTGQFICSFPFGKISDKVGRRDLILYGTFISAILSILFGFSSTIYIVLSIRFFQGLLNGNPGLSKAYIGDIATKESRSFYYSFLILAWGIGCIIGSMIGGYAYIPDITYPAYLSCLIASLISFSVFIWCYFNLEESIPNKITITEYINNLFKTQQNDQIEQKIEQKKDDYKVYISIAIYVIMCIVDISTTETSLIWMVTDSSTRRTQF